jgi:hypothetical protein
MNNFVIFVVGIVVTLITGMGVITSTVFLGYKKENIEPFGSQSRVSEI